MVLVLPKVDSFGERFGRAIGQGAGAGMEKGLESKRLKEQMAQENETFKKMGIDLTGISPEMRKPFVENFLALQGKQVDANDAFNMEQLKHQNALELEGYKNKNKVPDVNALKYEKELEDEEKVKKIGQQSFNTAARLLKKKNIGQGSGIISMFGGDTARDTGEFNAAMAGLESMLVHMVSGKTLSDARFNYIKNEILPKSTDSLATIEGKLKSLADELGFDPSALIGEDVGADMDLENSKPNKKLTPEAMAKIKKLSGGDYKEGMRIAKKMGYIVE